MKTALKVAAALAVGVVVAWGYTLFELYKILQELEYSDDD